MVKKFHRSSNDKDKSDSQASEDAFSPPARASFGHDFLSDELQITPDTSLNIAADVTENSAPTADISADMPLSSGISSMSADTQLGGKILVRFATDADAHSLLPSILEGASITYDFRSFKGLVEVELSFHMSVDEAISLLQANSSVLAAQADFQVNLGQSQPEAQDISTMSGGGGPSAPQWDMQKINAGDDAWNTGLTTGKGVTVAVIDTGVDANHPDLVGKMWTNVGEIVGNGIDDDSNGFIDDIHGWDFVNNDNNPNDDNFHGTHVAGTIAATADNGIGMAGVAPDVNIMSVKILDANGSGNFSNAAKGIDYAVANGAEISNNSWGPVRPAFVAGFGDIVDVQALVAADHIFVYAAGNNAQESTVDNYRYVGDIVSNSVAVASTTPTDTLSFFSNYGVSTVDLAAPGGANNGNAADNILSTMPGGGYGTLAGTSMASPHVAGALALLRSMAPDLSSAQLIATLLNSTDQLASLAGKVETGGRLDVLQAIDALLVHHTGTSGDDTFDESASLRPTAMTLGDGNDTGIGSNYNDRLDGGSGDDTLTGNGGDDMLTGGTGSDTLDGGSGTDTADYTLASGSITVDLMTGTASGTDGADTLVSIENVRASNFGDTLIGDDNANILTSGGGNDALYGNGGDDTLRGSGGTDTFDGGAGDDTLTYQYYTAAVTIDLTSGTILNIERIVGSLYGDTITGDVTANYLSGLAGNDTINGGDGDDTILRGIGDDSFIGGSGIDTLIYDVPEAVNAIHINLVAGTVTDDGNCIVEGIENVNASACADSVTITGNAGDNVLIGGSGDDILIASAGNDVIDGGLGMDILDYSSFTPVGTAIIDMSTGTTNLGSSVTYISIEGVRGTVSDNNITGSAGDNILLGNIANDTLYGNDGNDILNGGAGNDALYGGAGNDTLWLQSGTDILDGGAGSDTLRASSGSYSVIYDFPGLVLTGDYVNYDTMIDLNAGSAIIKNYDTQQTITQATFTGIENYDGSDIQFLQIGTYAAATEATVGSAYIIGTSGANIMKGGNYSADTFDGGQGADILDGGSQGGYSGVEIKDTVVYHGAGIIAINIDPLYGFGLGGEAQGDILLNIENIDVSDTTGDFSVVGNFRDNTILVSDGSYNIQGDAGNDFIGRDVFSNHLNGVGLSTSSSIISGYFITPVFSDSQVAHPTDTISYRYFTDKTGGMSIDLQNGAADILDVVHDTLVSIENAEGNFYLNNVLTGSNGDNRLEGGMLADTIMGGAGNDILVGYGGADTLDGGSGSDTLELNAVASTNTTLIHADLASGTETHYSGTTLLSTAALSNIENISNGSAIASQQYGNASDNTLTGGAGSDALYGGDGNDTLHGKSGADYLDGQNGNDIINGYNGTGATGSTLLGGAGDDTILIGAGSYAQIDGGSGNDALSFNTPPDILAHLNFFGTADFYVPYHVLVMGGAGTTINLSAGTAFIASYNYAIVSDYSYSFSSIENVNLLSAQYSNYNSTIGVHLIGNDENNYLGGTRGHDTIEGGAGADTLNGGLGSDTASYASSDAGVNVNLTTNVVSGGDATGDTFIDIENITGSAFDDTLVGNIAANILDGGGGADTVDYSAATSALTVNLAAGTATGGGIGNDMLSNIENIVGSAFNDTFTANAAANVFTGNAGIDTVSYLASAAGVNANLFMGGSGGDATGDTYINIENLTGSAFNDVLAGNAVANILDGGTGSDTVSYASSDTAVNVNLATGQVNGGYAAGDTLIGIENIAGSAFDDTLTGDAGNNALSGDAGNDILVGGAGADTLDGGLGTDFVSYLTSVASVVVNLATGIADGGDAIGDILISIENLAGSLFDDTLVANASANVLDGGLGTDTASYAASSAGVSINLATGSAGGGDAAGDTLISIENLTGSAFDDTLAGDAGNNVLIGGIGNDMLTGGAGADTLDGDLGNDTASYSASNAGVTVNLTLTTAQSGGHAAGDRLWGIENVIGSAYNDQLTGDAQANTLTGGAGNDALSGGNGDDLLIGGAGADVLNGGNGLDTVSYVTSAAAVTVNLGFGLLGVGGDALGDTFSGIENIIGSSFNDTLTGNNGANVIHGGDGNDIISDINNGPDQLYGDAGNDTITGNSISSACYGGDGNDTITLTSVAVSSMVSGGDGNDNITVDAVGAYVYGGAGDDTVTINASGSNVYGEAGNDTLVGQAGIDILDGGIGSDILHGHDGGDIIFLGNDTDADSVRYNAKGDGGLAGEVTGYDSITGFHSGEDNFDFGGTLKSQLNDSTAGADGSLFFRTNTALNFNGICEAWFGDTGFTDASFLQSSWVTVRSILNGYGVTAADGADGLIVAVGESTTAIFVYTESTGNGGIAAHELMLLGIVDTQLTTGDFGFYS